MAIVVVSGSGRGAGKTALVCGLIAALPEFAWVAVKVTTHAHSVLARIYEEPVAENSCAQGFDAGQQTDTARYLAAGAWRAFLVSALDSELDKRLSELRGLVGLEANLLFESNRVLRHVQPDVCLAIEADADAPRKPSFTLVERVKQATVRRAGFGAGDKVPGGAEPVFELTDFASIPESMQQWLRARLLPGARPEECLG